MLTNPFGVNEHGALVLASSVKRGLACNCVCPACSEPLVANQGPHKVPYFSHAAGADCGSGVESAMHLLAKEIVSEAGKLAIPSHTVESRSSVSATQKEIIIKNRSLIKVVDVELEKETDSMIADCLVTAAGGQQLIVEIKVTHAVDEIKMAKLEDAEISTIEYDFGALYRKLTNNRHKPLDLADLREKLLPPLTLKDFEPKPGHGSAKWLFNKKGSEVQQDLDRLQAERDRASLRRIEEQERKETELKKWHDKLSGETCRQAESYRRKKDGY